MKLTSRVFVFLYFLLFCSYSFVISAPDVDSEAIKKISSKLERYKKLIPLIHETLLRYCQLCEDINTTYSIRLENYFGENSEQYEMLSKAYYQFKDEEDELIDGTVLPSFTTIKNDINRLYMLMEVTPDSEKDLDEYKVLELQIRDSLRTTLQSIELHILKVAEILGFKNDIISKIRELLGFKKSQFSDTISPKKYLEAIRTLIEEVHEQIEEQLSTSSKLNPVQKLYIGVKNTFKNPLVEKLDISWQLFTLLCIDTLSACFDQNSMLQALSPYQQITEAYNNLQTIRNRTQMIITDSDEQLLTRLNNPIQLPQSVNHSSFFVNLIPYLLELPNLSDLEKSNLNKTKTSLENLELLLKGLSSSINFNVDLDYCKLPPEEVQEDKEAFNKYIEEVKVEGAPKEIITQFINYLSQLNSLKQRVLEKILLAFRQKLIELQSTEFDSVAAEKYELLIKEIDQVKKNHQLNSKKVQEKLLGIENSKLKKVASMKEKIDLQEKVYSTREEIIAAALLLKRTLSYAGIIIKLLKEAQPLVEKLIFPNKQDRMEKLGMQHPYARPGSSEKDETKKAYAHLKNRTQVKPKVKASQVIGWEKLAEELQGKIDYCKEPLRYRNTELYPLIIAGEPGTGKSFTAEAIADICGRNLYQLTSDMVDIQTLNTLFKMLEEDAPCILFIDEAHCYFDNNDRHAKLFQSYLLPKLTAPANKFRKIYVILATNQPDKLPGDIWRRCSTLWCGLPGIEEREKALQIYLEENGYMCDASFEKLFVNLTEDMNFDDLHIILDKIKGELISLQQHHIDEELFKKGLKSVYQHKLKSIAFDPKLSRTELLDAFIEIPFTLFKKYINEWKDIRRSISLEEIKSTFN